MFLNQEMSNQFCKIKNKGKHIFYQQRKLKPERTEIYLNMQGFIKTFIQYLTHDNLKEVCKKLHIIKFKV